MELTTERLIIRPMILKDLSAIHEYLKDGETMRFFVEGTYSLDKVKEVIENNIKKTNKFSVLLKDSLEVIGHLSFHTWGMKDTYEIGWIFNKSYYGNGYASEAAKAMLHHAFTDLKAHRIIATCQPENIASIRIMEKLAMRLEGNNKKCIYYKEDIWWDELFYAILEEEYKG